MDHHDAFMKRQSLWYDSELQLIVRSLLQESLRKGLSLTRKRFQRIYYKS